MIFKTFGNGFRQSGVWCKGLSNKSQTESKCQARIERIQHASYQIIQPGNTTPSKSVSECISKPDYSMWTLTKARRSRIVNNSEEMIRKMRQTCALAKHVLHTAATVLKPGATTNDIDEVVHKEIIKCGAYPSTLHYKGFPKSCCTSVNNVVCHGIPDDTVLQEGDIINIDITVFYLGCHGDTSDTFQIGEVDENASNLISTTQDCLHHAISICQPGATFSKIPEIIEPLASSNGFQVCPRFVGHGIGEHFHTAPNIWHVRSRHVDKRIMEPGMIFTIEPILMEGNIGVKTLKDGWTTISKDNLRSAQAEHTILITSSGKEVLTA